MAELKLTNARKSFGSIDVLHGIDLAVKDGEFVVFVGPSGCGKSTLLRVIAGRANKVTVNSTPASNTQIRHPGGRGGGGAGGRSLGGPDLAGFDRC